MPALTHTNTHTQRAFQASSLLYCVHRGKGDPWNDSWHDGSRSSAAWAVWYQHFSAWLWTSKAGGFAMISPGCSSVSARMAEVTDTSPRWQLTRRNADTWKTGNSGYSAPCLYKFTFSSRKLTSWSMTYTWIKMLENTRVCFKLNKIHRLLCGSIHWQHLRTEACVWLTSLSTTAGLFLVSVGALFHKT